MAANGRPSAVSFDRILQFIQDYQGTVNEIAGVVGQLRVDLATLTAKLEHLQQQLGAVSTRETQQSDRRFTTVMNVVGWVVAAVSLAVAVLK